MIHRRIYLRKVNKRVHSPALMLSKKGLSLSVSPEYHVFTGCPFPSLYAGPLNQDQFVVDNGNIICPTFSASEPCEKGTVRHVCGHEGDI